MFDLNPITVKIINPTLLKVLKDFEEIDFGEFEIFDGRGKYDIYLESVDSTVSGCPKSLDDLKQYIVDLLAEFGVFRNEKFADYFENNYPEIEKDYSYVYWICYEDEDENEEFEFGKPYSKKNKYSPKTLSEIFPNMDSSKDNGLVLNDGKEFITYNWRQHKEFLGEDSCVFLPANVVAFNPDSSTFNCIGAMVEKFVITTNMEQFESINIMIDGFKYFFIVDAETNKVVYSSKEFEYTNDMSFLDCSKLLKKIAKYTKCS